MDEHAKVLLRLIAAVVVALLAGCGGDAAEPPDADAKSAKPTAADRVNEGTPGSDPAPQPPATAPPKLGALDEPPPAWMAASSGTSWMAYGTYCWGSCVLMRGPAEHDDLPRLDVQPGETLAFHLEFDPTELSLSISADGEPQQMSLPARRNVTWEATRGGVVSLAARRGGSDASYHARVVVDGSEESPRGDPGAQMGEGG